MKWHTYSLVALILFAGCRASRQTGFFLKHDAGNELRKLASAAGLELGGGGGGQSGTGPFAEKRFSVSIKGTESDLTDLLYKYRALVEKAIAAHGMKIGGRGNWSGGMRGFELRYRNSGRTGLLRVNAVLDKRGDIQIEVFMYEHD